MSAGGNFGTAKVLHAIGQKMEQQVDQKQLGDMLKKSAKLQHVLALIFFLKFSHSISTSVWMN